MAGGVAPEQGRQRPLRIFQECRSVSARPNSRLVWMGRVWRLVCSPRCARMLHGRCAWTNCRRVRVRVPGAHPGGVEHHVPGPSGRNGGGKLLWHGRPVCNPRVGGDLRCAGCNRPNRAHLTNSGPASTCTVHSQLVWRAPSSLHPSCLTSASSPSFAPPPLHSSELPFRCATRAPGQGRAQLHGLADRRDPSLSHTWRVRWPVRWV